jgi:hypothetical protein
MSFLTRGNFFATRLGIRNPGEGSGSGSVAVCSLTFLVRREITITELMLLFQTQEAGTPDAVEVAFGQSDEEEGGERMRGGR